MSDKDRNLDDARAERVRLIDETRALLARILALLTRVKDLDKRR